MGSVVLMAGVGGLIAGQFAPTAINAAATADVMPEDGVTPEIKLQSGPAVTLAEQFKATAGGRARTSSRPPSGSRPPRSSKRSAGNRRPEK